jgi:hypothetical protein
MVTKRVDNQQQGGLIQLSPSDLQQEYPHIVRGSYGIVFKVCPNFFSGLWYFLFLSGWGAVRELWYCF